MELILTKLIVSGDPQAPLYLTLLYRECTTEKRPVPGEPCEVDDDIPQRVIEVTHNLSEDRYYGFCGIQVARDMTGCEQLVDRYLEHGWRRCCPRRRS